MKKGKRLLAVLLAMVMMLSTMSAAMMAFAEETTPENTKDKIAEEIGKYLPEDFDKDAAKAEFDNFANQVVKGAESLYNEAAENEELASFFAAAEENVASLFAATEPTTGAQKFMTALDKIQPDADGNYTDTQANNAFKSYYKDVGKAEDLKSVPEEYMNKYFEIFTWYVEAHKNKDPFDRGTFQPLDVQYPVGASYDKVSLFLTEADTFLSETLADALVPGTTNLLDALEKGVYTNYSVTTIDATIYKLLASIASSLPAVLQNVINTYPADVAATWDEDSATYLDLIDTAVAEERYNAAHAQWESILNNTDPEPQKIDFYWDYMVEKGVDWGFEDGDRDGFIKALAHSLDRLGDVINLLVTFSEKDNMQSGAEKLKFQYGIYNEIATLLEILGAKDFINVEDYHAYVRMNQTIQTKDDTTALQFEVILTSLFNFIEQIAAAPATELMNILPRLAYIIDSGYLTKGANNAADRNKTFVFNYAMGSIKIAGTPIYPFNLSAEGIFDLLEGIADPDVASGVAQRDGIIKFNAAVSDTSTVEIKLSKQSVLQLIRDLGHCGTLSAKESTTSRTTKYIPDFRTNAPDAFVTLFRWAYKFITGDVIAYALLQSIEDGSAGPVKQFVINAMANALKSSTGDLALMGVINALTLKLPELPALPEVPGDGGSGSGFDFGKLIETILGFLGLGGNGGNNPIIPENPDIPHTAGKTAGLAVAVLAVVSVAGIAICTKKKHED